MAAVVQEDSRRAPGKEIFSRKQSNRAMERLNAILNTVNKQHHLYAKRCTEGCYPNHLIPLLEELSWPEAQAQGTAHQLMLAGLSSGTGSSRGTTGRHKWKSEVGRQDDQLSVIRSLLTGLLPPRFMFQSFKQLVTESELLYLALQRSSWKRWNSAPSMCADQSNKPYCSHSKSDASKKEIEGMKWGRTAAACWQYLTVVLAHLNYFSSSDLTLSLCLVHQSTAESLRVTTLLFPL